MHAVDALATLFLLASAASVVLATEVPALHPFLDYGKTWRPLNRPSGALARLAAITVPHDWFWHFYLLLLVTVTVRCIFKGADIRTALLLVQAIRRLFEQFVFFKHSSSRMHLSHYLVGLAFYMMEALAVVPSRVHGRKFGILIFSIASTYQLACHYTLSVTQKYRLPKFPLASSYSALITACPHYGAEIIIYFAFACIADPRDMGGLTVTVATIIWVVVSLGVASRRARALYENDLMKSECHQTPADSETWDDQKRNRQNSNNRPQYIRWSAIPYVF